VIATLSEVASIAPWTFTAGTVVGFIVGARYRIVRKTEED
jgi:hypothetical protein